jgi:hypothetical protein
MGKVANAKRKKLFNDIINKDTQRQAVLDKPRYESACCLIKFEKKLPNHFVKCYNCPLDTED